MAFGPFIIDHESTLRLLVSTIADDASISPTIGRATMTMEAAIVNQQHSTHQARAGIDLPPSPLPNPATIVAGQLFEELSMIPPHWDQVCEWVQ